MNTMNSSPNTETVVPDDIAALLSEQASPEDNKISQLEADLDKEKKKRRQEKFIHNSIWVAIPGVGALVFTKIWLSSLLIGIIILILIMAIARRCEQRWAILILNNMLSQLCRISSKDNELN